MNIIAYPLSTEKTIRMMESENKLIFIVSQRARKPEIKKEIENMFDVKVVNIRTANTPDNKKKAYITFDEETPAIDIATQLGLM
ncbi:50S ribosomal protein L23 [Candidatus Woesearchaeota archaeon]|nr:50S ribosomal protein L23 [Candidatus Woesearchaeota archaeon]